MILRGTSITYILGLIKGGAINFYSIKVNKLLIDQSTKILFNYGLMYGGLYYESL
jgi:hypothetical protein